MSAGSGDPVRAKAARYPDMTAPSKDPMLMPVKIQSLARAKFTAPLSQA
jgi:hypothetical protein